VRSEQEERFNGDHAVDLTRQLSDCRIELQRLVETDLSSVRPGISNGSTSPDMRVLSPPPDLPRSVAAQPNSMRSEPMAAIDDLSSQRFYHGSRADLKTGDLIDVWFRCSAPI